MDKLDKKLKEYYYTFGDYFPTEEVCLTKEEIINAIDDCIKTHKTAKEYFNLNYDKDVNY